MNLTGLKKHAKIFLSLQLEWENRIKDFGSIARGKAISFRRKKEYCLKQVKNIKQNMVKQNART